MVTLFVFVTGFALAMALFHLVRALVGFTPDFSRETLDEIGILGAFFVYCGTGPVLLLMHTRKSPPRGTAALSLGSTLALTCLILVWTGSLGVVALESARALL